MKWSVGFVTLPKGSIAHTKNIMKPYLGSGRAVIFKDLRSVDDLVQQSHPSSSGPLL